MYKPITNFLDKTFRGGIRYKKLPFRENMFNALNAIMISCEVMSTNMQLGARVALVFFQNYQCKLMLITYTNVSGI